MPVLDVQEARTVFVIKRGMSAGYSGIKNDLFDQLTEYCKLYKSEIKSDKKEKIKKSLTFLKNKAKTLEDIFNNGQYIMVDEVNFNQEDVLRHKLVKKIIMAYGKNEER